jgi:hypothetical protein
LEAVDESSLMVDPNSGQTKAASGASAPATTTAVEFYCRSADRYLMTGDAMTISALDTGCMPGWARTGQILTVFAATAHIFRRRSTCAAIRSRQDSGQHIVRCAPARLRRHGQRLPNSWPQSSGNAPSVSIPNESDGSCGAGTIPVYGLYDNRPDHNRRYTTSLATRDQLRAIGWSAEGAGPLGVVMCAAAP